AAGFRHRLREEAIGLVASLAWRKVIALVEVDGVDLRERDELGDLHDLVRLLLEGLQFLGREDDVLALLELVALDDVVALHDRAVLAADELLLHARVVLVVQHVEGDRGLRLARRKEIHRDRDEAEGDGGRAVRSASHKASILRFSARWVLNRAPFAAAARGGCRLLRRRAALAA